MYATRTGKESLRVHQKTDTPIRVGLFFLIKEIRTIQCSAPVEHCPLSSSRKRHNTVRNADRQRISSGPPKNRFTHPGGSVFYSERRFEQINSTPRWGVDRRRLDGGGSILSATRTGSEFPRIHHRKAPLENYVLRTRAHAGASIPQLLRAEMGRN